MNWASELLDDSMSSRDDSQRLDEPGLGMDESPHGSSKYSKKTMQRKRGKSKS